MELFEVDSVDSGPAYFQPTGIFEVTRPQAEEKEVQKGRPACQTCTHDAT